MTEVLSEMSAVMMVRPVLVAVALAFWSWFVFSLLRRYARFRRVEMSMAGPKSLPLLGNTLDVLKVNPDNIFPTIMRLWGGRNTELSRFSFFNQLVVIVSDPDHIGKVQ